MTLKRMTTIGVVVAAFAAWLAGAATSNHVVRPPLVVETPAIELRGAELATEIARLHERLRPTSTPVQPGRNLFTFRAAPPPRIAEPPPVPVPAPVSIVAPVAAALPALKLAGVAEDDTPEGLVRTAIISTGVQLFLVKEGELVTPRYRVATISTDVVELTDLTDNTIRRLAMR
jgi:hypothetical protein